VPEEKRFLTPPQAELKGKSLLMSQNVPNFLSPGKQEEASQSPKPQKMPQGRERPFSAPLGRRHEGLNIPLPKQAETLKPLGNWDGKGQEKACVVWVCEKGPSGTRGAHQRQTPPPHGCVPPAGDAGGGPGWSWGAGMEPGRVRGGRFCGDV